MITACLIGDQRLVDRLQTLASDVNSRLVPSITSLGIDLQGKLKQGRLGSQLSGSRGQLKELSTDLSVEQSDDAVIASICTDRHPARDHSPAGGAVFRASLRHNRAAFFRSISETATAVRAPTRDPTPGFPERSFLRSALDSMTTVVRDRVEATLEEAVSQ
jgi:hypothetical protein